MIYTRVRSVSESCKILSLTSKSRVGILWDPDDPAAAIAFNEYEAVAFPLKVQLHSLKVRGPKPDIEGAFRAATKGRSGGLIIVRNSLLNRHPKEIASLGLNCSVQFNPKLSVVSNWSDRSESAIKVPAVVTWL